MSFYQGAKVKQSQQPKQIPQTRRQPAISPLAQLEQLRSGSHPDALVQLRSITNPDYSQALAQLKVLKAQSKQTIQRKSGGNLPPQLQAGIESLSGIDMSHVQVHYNSAKPAQLNAHAYAQGSDIHLAPGQDKHLPHEAWHVVQQAQGRVQPKISINGTAINDSLSLEREADVMGGKAQSLQSYSGTDVSQRVTTHFEAVDLSKAKPQRAGIVQRKTLTVRNTIDNYDSDWQQGESQATGVEPGPRQEAQKVQEMCGGTWVGGHMVNDMLGGHGGYANIVPITSGMNGQHRTVENAAKNQFHRFGGPWEVRYYMQILNRANYDITDGVGGPTIHRINNLADQFQQSYEFRRRASGSQPQGPIQGPHTGPVLTMNF